MKKSIWNLLSLLILLVLIGSEIWLTLMIWRLDMLPGKYLVLLVAVLAVLAVFLGILMFPKRGRYQKKKGTGRRIVAYILAMIVSLGGLVAARAISRIHETVSAITETSKVSAVIGVYVLNDSAAQSIEDVKDAAFAVTDSYEQEYTEKTLAAIAEETGTVPQTVNYGSVFAMIDGLYAKEADALILNSAYLGVLEELEGYTDFSQNVRMIYEYHVVETVQIETRPTQETDADESPVAEQESQQVTGIKPFVLYLSGSDTRSKVLTTSRSDVNILAVVNPQTKQILLINTPRDYYVGNPAGNGALDKLTHCGIYGIDCSMAALAELYNEEISYYAQINFTGFETLIDALGGITVYSDVSFTTLHGKHRIEAGENHLNGYQALCFARERYALKDGDNDRGKNQMKVITAVVEKLSAGTIISNYNEILNSMQGMFVTNMTQNEISELVKMQLTDLATWTVLSYAVTGSDGSATTYSAPGFYAYVMYPNKSTVALATELIDRVMSGEALSSADLSQ